MAPSLQPHLNLLVCDGSDPVGSRTIADVRRTTTLHPDELSAARTKVFDQIFINMDFGQMQQLRSLREVLSAHSTSEIVMIVDAGKQLHWQTVQANSLRAQRVLKRPISRDDIVDVTTAYAKRLGRSAIAPSVEAAASAISGAFECVQTNSRLHLNEIAHASGSVMRELAHLGPEAWLANVRAHHEGTFQHCLLVTGVAAALANHLGLPPRDKIDLVGCAMLHDIGKAKIPRAILDKPGSLTHEERAIIQTHPAIAKEYFANVGRISSTVLDGIFHHHELLDGSGYPDGLTADRILPLTRMLTVCDIYSALVEERSYKPAKSPQVAFAVLTDMAGQGKLEYRIVAHLAAAFGFSLPERQVHTAQRSPQPSSQSAAL